MKKYITLEELKQRIKPGDLFYAKGEWYRNHGDEYIISRGEDGHVWGSMSLIEKHITKVFFQNTCNSITGFCNFLDDHNEIHLKDYITYIITYIGNPKEAQLETLIDKLKGQLREAEKELNTLREGI